MSKKRARDVARKARQMAKSLGIDPSKDNTTTKDLHMLSTLSDFHSRAIGELLVRLVKDEGPGAVDRIFNDWVEKLDATFEVKMDKVAAIVETYKGALAGTDLADIEVIRKKVYEINLQLREEIRAYCDEVQRLAEKDLKDSHPPNTHN